MCVLVIFRGGGFEGVLKDSDAQNSLETADVG